MEETTIGCKNIDTSIIQQGLLPYGTSPHPGLKVIVCAKLEEN